MPATEREPVLLEEAWTRTHGPVVIVVSDTLSAQEVDGVRGAMDATGADVAHLLLFSQNLDPIGQSSQP